MKNEGNVSKIISFINNNFLDGESSVQTRNIRKLLSYLVIDNMEELLSIDDINEILNNCPKLRVAIDSILKNESYQQFMDDDNLSAMISICAESKGITLKEKEENKKQKDGKIEDVALYFSYSDAFTNLLTSKEEIALSKELHGESQKEALEEFAMKNIKLVISIASKYRSADSPNSSIGFDDLVQEGLIGLLKAIELFDPKMGYKFSTYATWWIRHFIKRALGDQSRTIRIPLHLSETVFKVNGYIAKVEKEYGYTPTKEEIVTELGISEEIVDFALNKSTTLSLDDVINPSSGEENEEPLINFISSDYSLEEDAVNRIAREEFMKKFNETRLLKDRDKRVLEVRYGFGDGEQKTLADVGKEFKVTRERIRQIESRALRRLRKSPEFKGFSH